MLLAKWLAEGFLDSILATFARFPFPLATVCFHRGCITAESVLLLALSVLYWVTSVRQNKWLTDQSIWKHNCLTSVQGYSPTLFFPLQCSSLGVLYSSCPLHINLLGWLRLFTAHTVLHILSMCINSWVCLGCNAHTLKMMFLSHHQYVLSAQPSLSEQWARTSKLCLANVERVVALSPHPLPVKESDTSLHQFSDAVAVQQTGIAYETVMVSLLCLKVVRGRLFQRRNSWEFCVDLRKKSICISKTRGTFFAFHYI